MKIKQIELSKSLKIGLPNYSNVDVHAGITFELGENEEPDWTKMWDELNYQMWQQTDGVDPSWIQTKEYKNFFKINLRQNK